MDFISTLTGPSAEALLSEAPLSCAVAAPAHDEIPTGYFTPGWLTRSLRERPPAMMCGGQAARCQRTDNVRYPTYD